MMRATGTTGARGRRRVARLAGLLLVLAVAAPAAGAGHVEVRVALDEAAGELPEGVAVTKTGDVMVSIAPLGELWRIPDGTGAPQLVGSVPGWDGAGFGLLGLAVNARGDVFAGMQAVDAAVRGVYRFDRRSGDATRLPGTEAIAFPNDVAFDQRGNLYITDSAAGGVWRWSKRGVLTPWLVHPDLAGLGLIIPGLPIGANGIEYHRGALYVTNTEKSLLVRIPIRPDGSPGTHEVVADFTTVRGGFDALPDGLAMDVHGTAYVAMIAGNEVLAVSDAGIASVAAGDPLDWPSSVAFGTGSGDAGVLFAVNFSVGEGFGDPTPRDGPGLVAIDVGVPGDPLP